MFTAERKTKAMLLADEQAVQKSRLESGRSTIRIWYTDGREVLKYHDTHVVTRYPDGRIVLNSGGFRTKTTRERICDELGNERIWVQQEKGIWRLGKSARYGKNPQGEYPLIEEGRMISEFYDGITINSAGELISEERGVDRKKIARTLKEIKAYVNGITESNLAMPSKGDCWFCGMQTKEGESLGDAVSDTEHLISHMKEGYLPGSLVYNALIEQGYGNPALVMRMGVIRSIRRAVRRYLKKRLLPELAS